LVRKHDKNPAVGGATLLVTVGAPTRTGWSFPSSAVLASMISHDPDPLGQWLPERLAQIVIHDVVNSTVRWLVGEAPWNVNR